MALRQIAEPLRAGRSSPGPSQRRPLGRVEEETTSFPDTGCCCSLCGLLQEELSKLVVQVHKMQDRATLDTSEVQSVRKGLAVVAEAVHAVQPVLDAEVQQRAESEGRIHARLEQGLRELRAELRSAKNLTPKLTDAEPFKQIQNEVSQLMPLKSLSSCLEELREQVTELLPLKTSCSSLGELDVVKAMAADINHLVGLNLQSRLELIEQNLSSQSRSGCRVDFSKLDELKAHVAKLVTVEMKPRLDAIIAGLSELDTVKLITADIIHLAGLNLQARLELLEQHLPSQSKSGSNEEPRHLDELKTQVANIVTLEMQPRLDALEQNLSEFRQRVVAFNEFSKLQMELVARLEKLEESNSFLSNRSTGALEASAVTLHTESIEAAKRAGSQTAQAACEASSAALQASSIEAATRAGAEAARVVCAEATAVVQASCIQSASRAGAQAAETTCEAIARDSLSKERLWRDAMVAEAASRSEVERRLCKTIQDMEQTTAREVQAMMARAENGMSRRVAEAEQGLSAHIMGFRSELAETVASRASQLGHRLSVGMRSVENRMCESEVRHRESETAISLRFGAIRNECSAGQVALSQVSRVKADFDNERKLRNLADEELSVRMRTMEHKVAAEHRTQEQAAEKLSQTVARALDVTGVQLAHLQAAEKQRAVSSKAQDWAQEELRRELYDKVEGNVKAALDLVDARSERRSQESMRTQRWEERAAIMCAERNCEEVARQLVYEVRDELHGFMDEQRVFCGFLDTEQRSYQELMRHEFQTMTRLVDSNILHGPDSNVDKDLSPRS